MVYGHIECILKTNSNISTETFSKPSTNNIEFHERLYQTHHAISYSFKVVSSIKEWKHEVELYRGENAVDSFLLALHSIQNNL